MDRAKVAVGSLLRSRNAAILNPQDRLVVANPRGRLEGHAAALRLIGGVLTVTAIACVRPTERGYLRAALLLEHSLHLLGGLVIAIIALFVRRVLEGLIESSCESLAQVAALTESFWGISV